MELLRHYEPVIRYTQGEQFFPMDVVRYVAACNLWAHYPNGRDELLVRQEDLTYYMGDLRYSVGPLLANRGVGLSLEMTADGKRLLRNFLAGCGGRAAA